MLIQWYPGHMNKASKEIKSVLPSIDLIIEIIDARIPFSSQNPMLAKIRGQKPCIKLLNKSDLADIHITKQWQIYLEKEQGVKTLALSAKMPQYTESIIQLCYKLSPEKREHEVINVLVMGIPNVGKSTLINLLAKRIIAKTGNEPAITKYQQRIDLHNGIVLFDTPGLLWGNIENQNSGYRLAVTGAIRDTALNHYDVAYFATEYLSIHYSNALKNRFNLSNISNNTEELLFIIGKQRGCLKNGGKLDTDKIAKILLNECRDGTLGQITWELPEMIEQELIELEKIREEKTTKKAARKHKSNHTSE